MSRDAGRQARYRVEPKALAFNGRDECEPNSGHRADEARLTRIILEHLTQFADLLGQCVVGDRSVIPHRVEERALGDELPVTLNKD